MRGAPLEDKEMWVPSGGLDPKLICPFPQAFSAFADLTIKSLADIEEEVGAGVGRGSCDHRHTTPVSPSLTPPLQG